MNIQYNKVFFVGEENIKLFLSHMIYKYLLKINIFYRLWLNLNVLSHRIQELSYMIILKKVWICANLIRTSLRKDVMIENINRNSQKIAETSATSL